MNTIKLITVLTLLFISTVLLSQTLQSNNQQISVDQPSGKLVAVSNVNTNTETNSKYTASSVSALKSSPATISEKAYGKAESAASSRYIGELYGGGIVFWISPDGQHGLVASLKDLDEGKGYPWSNVAGSKIGKTAANMTNGKENTKAIVSQAGHTKSAAKLCTDYRGGGFSDWYLPSNRELTLLASQDVVIDYVLDNDGNPSTLGFVQEYSMPTFGRYWSSTEYVTAHDAWGCGFSAGSSYGGGKDNTYRVRAIRAF